VIPYLTIALAVCSLFATAYMNFVRPARRRRKAGLAAPVIAAPGPEIRVPRDLDRQYPRPKGGRRKLDKTCPVCGTGAETTALDGRILGWPAHASCAEWLGDWRPKALAGGGEYAAEPFTQGAFDSGPIPVGPVSRSGGSTIAYMGGTVATVIGWGGGAGGSSTYAPVTPEMIMTGQISPDEARLRLNAEMLGAYGVPGPDLGGSAAWTRKACPDCGMEFSGTPADLAASFRAHEESGQCEQRRKKRAPAAPVFPEYCTCGWSTTIGTAQQNRRALDAHHASGECPHSVKGRAADRPKPNFAPNNPTGPVPPDTHP
jgi:hypothetical protein